MSASGTTRTFSDVRVMSAIEGISDLKCSWRAFRILTRGGSRADWTLPPIVDDVGAGAAIAGIVVPMHGDALDFCAKPPSDKMQISLVAGHVRTSQQGRHIYRHRPKPLYRHRPKPRRRRAGGDNSVRLTVHR